MRRESHVRFWEGGGVRLPSATRLVVLCKKGATQALAQVRRWVEGMKLKLNEEKTSIRDARKEHFRFLGYEFGPMVFTRTGRRYLGARPSKKAMSKARERVSQILQRGRVERWEEIRVELNQFLRGWAGYFAYGRVYPAFHALDLHVAQRVRNLLRRRYKEPSSTTRFGYYEVHRNLGVLELQSLLR
jgi:RNA-directed DNA polymerase